MCNKESPGNPTRCIEMESTTQGRRDTAPIVSGTQERRIGAKEGESHKNWARRVRVDSGRQSHGNPALRNPPNLYRCKLRPIKLGVRKANCKKHTIAKADSGISPLLPENEEYDRRKEEIDSYTVSAPGVGICEEAQKSQHVRIGVNRGNARGNEISKFRLGIREMRPSHGNPARSVAAPRFRTQGKMRLRSSD